MPNEPKLVWKKPLPSDGFGGLAATEDLVVVSCRDPLDQSDLYMGFDPSNGKRLWQTMVPAPGKLDYGNAPRATPIIRGNRVFLLGAFGDLLSIVSRTGAKKWHVKLTEKFPGELPTWGYCGSPVLTDQTLVLQTNCPAANLICLDLESGEEVWRSSAEGISYSSIVATSLGDTECLIGYDARQLRAWDLKSGRPIWNILPTNLGDFNVPTPIISDGQIWLSTENNGTRRYQLASNLAPPELRAENADLAPDTHSPVLSGKRILGVWNGLHCLDAQSLQSIWKSDDETYQGYASIIATDQRALVLTQFGDLILIATQGDTYRELGRWRLSSNHQETHSHPALAGHTIFVRVGKELRCYELDAAKSIAD